MYDEHLVHGSIKIETRRIRLYWRHFKGVFDDRIEKVRPKLHLLFMAIWRKQWKFSPYDVQIQSLVLFGATCSPFLLNATIDHHLKRFTDTTAKDIKRNIYVDNVQYTNDSEDEVIRFYERSKEIFLQAGMKLCEWATNSNELNAKIKLENDGKRTEK